MMRKGNAVLIVVIFGCMSMSLAQERESFDNRALYTKWYAADFFSDTSKWAWEVDVVYRRQSELGESDIWSNPLRYSFRPWIAYQFTKLTRVSFNPVGIYNSAPRFPAEDDLDSDFERELRTTVQINNYANYGRLNFTHRLRFESRWRGIDNPDGPVHNWRFRYRIRLRIPLNTDYFYTNNTVYWVNYHEAHMEWGKHFATNNLSQARNFVGLGYRFWDWTRVELGYIYQVNVRGNNRQLDITQAPMFYLFFDVLSRNQRRYKYSF